MAGASSSNAVKLDVLNLILTSSGWRSTSFVHTQVDAYMLTLFHTVSPVRKAQIKGKLTGQYSSLAP